MLRYEASQATKQFFLYQALAILFSFIGVALLYDITLLSFYLSVIRVLDYVLYRYICVIKNLILKVCETPTSKSESENNKVA